MLGDFVHFLLNPQHVRNLDEVGIDFMSAGVFRIVNVPKDRVHPVVMIECPRLLFPFAREIIATAVRDGGFPPLMLDPVDFVGLYRQNMERQAASGAKPS